MRTALRLRMHVLMVMGLALAGIRAHAGVLVYGFPPVFSVPSGSTFTTEVRMVSWDNTVGAFSLLLQYDPSAVRFSQVSIPTASPFSSNLFYTASSVGTGATRIVAFQTVDSASQTGEEHSIQVAWQAIGRTGRSFEIEASVEQLVDAQWLPVEVSAWPSEARIQAYPADSLEGAYSGLILSSNAPALADSGFITIGLGKMGAFSAKVTLGGVSYLFRGHLSDDGYWSGLVPRPG